MRDTCWILAGISFSVVWIAFGFSLKCNFNGRSNSGQIFGRHVTKIKDRYALIGPDDLLATRRIGTLGTSCSEILRRFCTDPYGVRILINT